MKCKPRKAQVFPCWRVAWGVGIPAWVAQTCHNLGDHKLKVNCFNGVSVANEGDVILKVDLYKSEVAVVSKEEFKNKFEVVEE